MRVGTNPAKHVTEFTRSAPVTVAIITYIPFLAGYFEQSLDVLKLCLASVRAHTSQPFDLLVFDNASSTSVVQYLKELQANGAIQFLVLSDKNVGMGAAWNFILTAAPGEYVAYADSDVYFHPGWLDEELKVLTAFEEVGMVCGLPAAHMFGKLNRGTLARAEADPQILVERGRFISDEWLVELGVSLGRPPEVFLAHCRQFEQVRLTRHGVSAYATASHFQFLARTRTLQPFLPIEVTKLVGDEDVLDQAIDDASLMRLSVIEPKIYHLGNTLTTQWRAEAQRLEAPVASQAPAPIAGLAPWLLRRPWMKKLVMKLYHHSSRWAVQFQ